MDALQLAAVQRARSALDLATSGSVPRAPGLLGSRYLKSLAAGDSRFEAERFADERRYGDVVKAAVASVASSNAPALLEIGSDFMAAVKHRSAVARALPLMRKWPVNTPTIRLSSGVSATWTAEGAAVPLSKGSYTKDGALDLLSVSAITPVTKEMIRAHADVILMRDLVAACALAVDQAFLDPSNTGTPDTKPASVFAGTSAGATAGPGADGFLNDLEKLAAALTAGSLDNAALICDTRTLMQLAALNVGISFDGDAVTYAGMPLIHTAAAPRMLGLVDLDRVTVVGFDAAELSVGREASLLMDDAPKMNSTTPTPAQLVSMFQVGTVALMASITANWRVVSGAAACIQNVDYTPVVGS